jgi:prepilin-type N-terminal cleavage/methylation domain-containing protein
VRKYRKEKFTLIELLVVVAIIGILVSLLLPSLVNAKNKAKIAVCLSQHKELGSAKALYLKDNNYKFHSTSPAGPDSPGKQWMGMKGEHGQWPATVTQRPLNVYLGHKTIGVPLSSALCPLEYKSLDSFKKVGSSYAGNSIKGYNSLKGKFMVQIENPSSSVLITEMGAIAYAENGNSYKQYWRLNHKPGKMIWPVARVDNSVLQHEFTYGEGRSWQSEVANFRLF